MNTSTRRGKAMKIIGLLLALAAMPAQARQSQAQPSVQTPQQTQQAQEARQQAEAYLRKEESATTVQRSQNTDRANQDATVADEAAGHSDAARPARSTNPNAMPPSTRPSGSTPGPSYGPVLNPRQPQATDPMRKDPAEVHDETDSLTRQPARTQPQQPQNQNQNPNQNQKQKQARQTQRRRQAWQPEAPMAPRPLNAPEAAAIGRGMVPVPPPAVAPQPVVPNTAPLSCVGGACRDPAGGSYNLGPSGTGVNSSGRPCTRGGATVTCL
jgi:hypothetical protein